jgi:outer membrane lipoprotein SlyB
VDACRCATSITSARTDDTYRIRTRTWTKIAPGTKQKDAATIALPAAGGAVVGALTGGKKGAAIGAAVGGGAGTAVVLSTRGKDVRLGEGAIVVVRLSEPLVIER